MANENYKSKWFNWTYFLISPIYSKEEAEYVIHDLKNIFYVIAGLLVILSLFTHLNVVLDVLIILTLATLLGINKSRTAAVMLLLYQLGVVILTIYSNITNAPHSGQNIALSVIIAVYAIGAVRATFKYHEFIMSKILWNNVLKIQMFSFLFSFVVLSSFSFHLKSFHFVNTEQTGTVIASIVILIYFLIFLRVLPFTKEWRTTGTQLTAESNLQTSIEPLNKFGGWLSFFEFFQWGFILLALYGLIKNIFKVIHSPNLIHASRTWVGFGITIVYLILYFYFVFQIRQRRSDIPNIISRVVILIFLFEIMLTFVEYAYGWDKNRTSRDLIISTLFNLITSLPCVLYFIKSKRVLAYYGRNAFSKK